MRTRKFPLMMICMSAALYPAISGAGPSHGFDACVNAFEKTLATSAVTGRPYKVIYQNDRFSSPLLEYYATAYTIDLQAWDPKTGRAFAQARCRVTRRGVVTAFAPLPMPSDSGTTRSADKELRADGSHRSVY